MSITLTVENYWELLALHKGLLEAKFHHPPNDRDVPRSPYVAAFANQVLDALIAQAQTMGKPDEADRWRRWRHIDKRSRFWTAAVAFAREDSTWLTMADRNIYARDLLSPFSSSEDDLKQFWDEVHQQSR